MTTILLKLLMHMGYQALEVYRAEALDPTVGSATGISSDTGLSWFAAADPGRP